MSWTLADLPDLAGRHVVITGANAGLGFETARVLAGAGASLTFACRNRAKADAAVAQLVAEHPGAEVAVIDLDLADLSSVAAAAERLHAEGRAIDVLVNNAGLMAIDEARTAEGLEMQYAVNHLAHFALTARLMPLVARSPQGRVVNVASMGHRAARGQADPRLEKPYDRWNAYFHSKLDNILFTSELQRRLAGAGSHVSAMVAHPGGADTDLGFEGSGVSNLLMRRVARFVTQPAAAGALPIVRAATDRTLPPGAFVGPRFVVRGRTPVVERPSRRARDEQAALTLWEDSVLQSGLDPVAALG